jgi:hypothetical protein
MIYETALTERGSAGDKVVRGHVGCGYKKWEVLPIGSTFVEEV